MTAPSIATAQLEEMQVKIQDYVDRLNATRPADRNPLRAVISPVLVSARARIRTLRTCWAIRISGTNQGRRAEHHWHPVVDALRELDIYNNHKRDGIPAIFRNASEQARATVLAELIDTDGFVNNNGTSYGCAQNVAHERIVDHARELAKGLDNHLTVQPPCTPVLRSHSMAEEHPFLPTSDRTFELFKMRGAVL